MRRGRFLAMVYCRDKEDCIYDNSLTGKKKAEDPSQTLNP